MQVEIARPHAPPAARVDLCIVIDVLRATTTASVLCHRFGELYVVRTPDDLGQLPHRPAGYALFSELSGVDSEHLRFDNSPVQAQQAEIGARTAVLMTTNGTRVVGLAMEHADEVVLAGFVNLRAVVAHVAARKPRSVAILPAGLIKRQAPCAEDDGCAEAIAGLLAGAPFDVDATVVRCRQDGRIVERRANEPTLAADIEICFAPDRAPVVPRVVPSSRIAGGWFALAPATPGVT